MTPVAVRSRAISHIGLVRKVNEDAILSLPERGLWVVSDGMGGHAGGDFASRTVVEAVAMLPPGLAAGGLMQAVRAALQEANATIRREAARRGAGVIGATVVALIVTDGHFVALWAGDSRLYRLRDGAVEMLTTDHSLVAELVLAGRLTWDEAERHPQSNAITRAVGVDKGLTLDKVRGDLRAGDRLLLCSDGLSRYTSQATLGEILRREPIESVADRLLETALAGGGGDNVSLIVVDVS
jgi:protein phosphatase/serine/threonine-protein phosphatase Stp1